MEILLFRSKPASKLILVSASVILTALLLLAAGEGFLRLRHGDLPPGPPDQAWFRFDPDRGWALKPGDYRFFHVGSHRPVRAFINEFGLRNAPLSLGLLEGRGRVTVLGDSFTFAEAVTDGDKFTDVLQSDFGPQTEVVNISVPGYGTGQQWLLLRDLIDQGYNPGGDLVLVFFTNDMQDNLGLDYRSLARDPKKPGFEIRADGDLVISPPAPSAPRNVQKSLIDRFLFLRFLRFRAELLVAAHPGLLKPLDLLGLTPSFERVPGIIAGWYEAGWENRWEATRGLLVHVTQSLRKAAPETRLHVAFIPSPLQSEVVFRDMLREKSDEDPRYQRLLADPDRPQRLLAAFCEREGLTFIDTTAPLRAAQRAYFPREGHLNEAGGRVVAKVLHQALTVP